MASQQLHSSIHHPITRHWCTLPNTLSSKSLIYPIFLTSDPNQKDPITSLPDQYRYGINQLIRHLTPLIAKGLSSVLLFGVPSTKEKDNEGTCATTEENPILNGIKVLKTTFPKLLIIVDVCLCAYTSHGHCGVLNELGGIDNDKSIIRIAEVAKCYAEAGADVIAPSDMMDNRIASIRAALSTLTTPHSIMSYSAKFASVLYGPFRDAAGSGMKFGDRKCYQLPVGAAGLASRAMKRDAEEGADFLMVKPGYSDIIADAKRNFGEYPIAVYQVSGEYSMIYHAAEKNVFTLKEGVMESIDCFLRAGASIIITYYTPVILDWLAEE